MPANIDPIYTLTPNISFCALTAANTAKDGTGTVGVAFTAGANGSYLKKLTFRAKGTNVQTVARVFINNGGSNTTATNNTLFKEITLLATTLSETTALADVELAFGDALPAGYQILITLGTAVAAGWQITAVGGDY